MTELQDKIVNMLMAKLPPLQEGQMYDFYDFHLDETGENYVFKVRIGTLNSETL